MSSFSPTMAELRSQIEAELVRFLRAKRATLPDAGALLDEVDRMIAAGGKRLRPAFCYWGYRATGLPHGEEIVRSAASLELLHTFAIVHDDIMDESDERRGEATVHALHGIDVAILAGDLALVLADGAFMSAGWEASKLTGAFAAYSRMREEVIAGQYLELACSDEVEITEDQARRIARLKSGRYTIEEPLAIGAALAGAAPELVEGLGRYGRPLGEAFQLRDDLLGTFGDRSTVGKPVDSDIREGKRNLLYAKTVSVTTGEDHRFLTERWGAGSALTADEVERLRGIVEGSGARAATEKLLGDLVDQATESLRCLGLDRASEAALAELITQATARTF